MKALLCLLAVLICVVCCGVLRADDWPQWRGPKRDGIWRESGVLEKFAAPQIKLRWRTAISSGYSGPTVAAGRVYVSDRITAPESQERVHCLDWTTGQTVWTYGYPCDYRGISFDAGPRASITIDDGRAYGLGAAGHFFCFDAAAGNVLWQKDLAQEYKLRLLPWGIAPAPLVEGDLVIVQVGGGPQACLIAFDKRTGLQRWTALDDPTSYASPLVVDQAGRRVLVCWTGTSLSGLDPATGALLWQHRWDHTGAWIDPIATPAIAANRVFVSCTLHGSQLLRLPPDQLQIETGWQRVGPGGRHSDGLHAVMSSPWIAGDCVYGFDNYGQLRCLDANTGKQLWEDRSAASQVIWGMAHAVRNGDKTWLFNDRGELLVSRLSSQGCEILSRAQLIKPTRVQLQRRGGVCWSHPAFAYRHVFARNDEELVCASLAAEDPAAAGLVAAPGSSSKADERPAGSEGPRALIAPFTAEQARESQQAWARHLGLPVEYTNLVGIKCVLIPPGEFDMGSTAAEIERLSEQARQQKLPAWYLEQIASEGPQRRVKITKPFYMSKYEVTVAQYRSFVRWGEYRPDSAQAGRDGQGLNATTQQLETGPQYTWEKPGFAQTDEQPVTNVSWHDAAAFCEYARGVEGDTWRLPTEAEWEYACRAGTTSLWASGDDERDLRSMANVADASLKLAWPKAPILPFVSVWDDGHAFAAPVGRFGPNAFGLHDMHGNVWEWCHDWYDPAYGRRSPREDPSGPVSGSARSCRGGSWNQAVPACRSAFRSGRAPTDRDFDGGFRVVQVW
ncbi:MAG: hypothetical protein A2V98_09625 [Planctomycetes bacterium RBG_16_64_12]|nr:MAG: hypothetical protein A2V98_09625 [Planctomycetes bacterium RBG_16_64_12]